LGREKTDRLMALAKRLARSNMVDEVYGVRGGTLEVTWPVAARGTVR
jgi:hypothetical protein